MSKFKSEIEERIKAFETDPLLKESAHDFLYRSAVQKYSYNFHWMERPIIQYPQDIVAMQELIWSIRPDLIIECGIAHGGSLILNASILALIDMCEAIEQGEVFNPTKSHRKVLGIDIDIRPHNLAAIQTHPMTSRIDMIEGSSISKGIINKVRDFAQNYNCILVCLDSNHTHDHVRAELDAYADLTSKGSYCVVFDTLIEDMPPDTYPDRPWGQGNNPKTAVWDFLKTHPEFAIDKSIASKYLITVAHDGFLKRIA
ncbi:MAG: cephalosporin hydroxylase family protein [Paracoccaceae bacterium]|nr:cephalosporin hydroxylase family protein [Paracoccaceae bacterium]MDE2916831.1 cephalosporin hydroxylase family protein [Paracoccaceae bacterium]